MLQTAQIQREEQYLKISDNDSHTVSNNILEKSDQDLDGDQAGDTLFQKTATFYYNKRVRVSLGIRDKYKTDFIMMRGLIEFHRPKNFLFNYDLKQWSIETDINADQLHDLHSFLSRVFAWLKHEKQFRLALKIALEFENRYRLERESVYEVLKNTTDAARKVY